jgi:hypothetical protein
MFDPTISSAVMARRFHDLSPDVGSDCDDAAETITSTSRPPVEHGIGASYPPN